MLRRRSCADVQFMAVKDWIADSACAPTAAKSPAEGMSAQVGSR